MSSDIQKLFFEFLLVISVVVSICLFWSSTLISSLSSILILAIAFVFFYCKEDIIFFIYGAILGPLAEIICIRYGVWQYSNPLFFGIPFWLVVVWGLAFMLSRRIRDTAFSLSHIKTHYFHHPNLIKFEKILVFDVVIYLLLILSLISFWQSNIPLFLLLLIVLAFTLSAYHMKEDVFFVVFTMVIGPTIEVICVYFGAWSYGNPSLLGIPIWLPLAYGIFGVLVRRTAITTVNYFWSS